MKIIGIGGQVRSGKDSLAELFLEDHYFGVSFGDIVRSFSHERHKDKPDPISIKHTTETSNWLRKKHGPDIVLQTALNEYEAALAADNSYHGLLLWSVRAPVEVDWILAHQGFLIWVEADVEVRHRRQTKHLRKGEVAISLDEFKQQEKLQNVMQPDIPQEVQMNLPYVRKKATHRLDNNGDNYDEFLRKAKALIRTMDAK